MNTGHELAAIAEDVENLTPHARHDAHVYNRIGGISNLNTNVGDV